MRANAANESSPSSSNAAAAIGDKACADPTNSSPVCTAMTASA